MPSILCVGGDVELLQTRAAVLRETGAEVRCAPSSKALAELESRHFDLVILCHSVKQEEAKQLYEAAHRRGAPSQVLRLTRGYGGLAENACADKIANTDPTSLVNAATELLHKQAQAEKSGIGGA